MRPNRKRKIKTKEELKYLNSLNSSRYSHRIKIERNRKKENKKTQYKQVQKYGEFFFIKPLPT